MLYIKTAAMEKHYELSDQEFEKQFQDCTLDPELFTHEAHLRLAWIHLIKYGEEKAIKNITAQLKNFVKHAGADEKYNHTLTIAAIKAVKHFIDQSSSAGFRALINEFPRLKNDFTNLIRSHYSTDIFKSEKAKQKYLKPDLIPFE